MIGSFLIHPKPGPASEVFAGHKAESVDEEFNHLGNTRIDCPPQYVAEGPVDIDVLNFEEQIDYRELTITLRRMGYRRATDLELIRLGVEHSDAVYRLIRGWTAVINGRIDPSDPYAGSYNEVSLLGGNRGLQIASAEFSASDDQITSCVAAVKI